MTSHYSYFIQSNTIKDYINSIYSPIPMLTLKKSFSSQNYLRFNTALGIMMRHLQWPDIFSWTWHLLLWGFRAQKYWSLWNVKGTVDGVFGQLDSFWIQWVWVLLASHIIRIMSLMHRHHEQPVHVNGYSYSIWNVNQIDTMHSPASLLVDIVSTSACSHRLGAWGN